MYQVKCFFLMLNCIPRPLWDFQVIIIFLLEQNNDKMFFFYLLSGYRKAIILINILKRVIKTFVMSFQSKFFS